MLYTGYFSLGSNTRTHPASVPATISSVPRLTVSKELTIAESFLKVGKFCGDCVDEGGKTEE